MVRQLFSLEAGLEGGHGGERRPCLCDEGRLIGQWAGWGCARGPLLAGRSYARAGMGARRGRSRKVRRCMGVVS